MHKTQLRNSLLLLLTATIWGVAFVAQSVGMEHVGPFTFSMLRSLIGGIVLLPVIFLQNKMNPSKQKSGADALENPPLDAAEKKRESKVLLLGGVSCGILLALACNFQQVGMQYTSVGRAGFITACYIIIVPILGLVFFKRKCRASVWLAVALALAGLYLLCMTGTFQMGKGDIFVLISSLLFSFHILVIDYFSPKVNGIRMSCIQFLVCGGISAIPAIVTETIRIQDICHAWMPILYAGALSCGIGYTLQIVGQKGLNPTVASLILSLESCISVVAGWLILGQRLSMRELCGCVLMFSAIILAQLPEKRYGFLRRTGKHERSEKQNGA